MKQNTHPIPSRNLNAWLVILGIVLAGLLVALLTGCERRNPKLEARVVALETNIIELTHLLGELGRSQSDAWALLSSQNTQIVNWNSTMSNYWRQASRSDREQWQALTALEESIARLSNAAPRYVITPLKPTGHAIAEPIHEGVPLSVYKAILQSAELQWPQDYRMQNYEIRNQVEAYRKLHPQR
jgi:hypothetical protein